MPAIVLHWLTVLLIIALVALGLYMTELKLSPMKLKLYSWHKWVGITVFLLAVARLVWRSMRPAPPPPPAMPAWQRVAAAVNHWGLYVLLIAIPISGWVMSSAHGVKVVYLGVLPLPDLVDKNKELAETLEDIHATLVYVMLALVALHVAAAIKHHVVDRDDVLHRMLPLLKPRN